jgi:hypothetical protein
MYVFCENETETVLTPTWLVQKLVVPLLDHFPESAYQRPKFLMDQCSKSDPLNQVWSIFEELALDVPDLFLIFDLMKWRSVMLMTMNT